MNNIKVKTNNGMEDVNLHEVFSSIKHLTYELKKLILAQPNFHQDAAIEPKRSGYKRTKLPFESISKDLIYYVKPLQVVKGNDDELVIELTKYDYVPQLRTLKSSIDDIWGFTSLDRRAVNAHHRYVGYIICTENQNQISNVITTLNAAKDVFQKAASAAFKNDNNKTYDSITNMLISNQVISSNENYEIITRHVRQTDINETVEKLTIAWKASGTNQTKKGDYQKVLESFSSDNNLTSRQASLLHEIHKYPEAHFLVRYNQRPAPFLSFKYLLNEKTGIGQKWETSIPITTPLIIYSLTNKAEFRATINALEVELNAGEIIAKTKTTKRKSQDLVRLLDDQFWYAVLPKKENEL